MREVPRLDGQRVILRPFRRTDVATRFELGKRWQTDYSREIAGDLAEVAEYTRERAESWFNARPESMKWAIEVDGQLAGEVRLDRIEEQDSNASLAIGIFSPNQRGKGLGSEAIALVLQHAFTNLNLHRVWLMVMESNKRAVAAYEKCGFTVEGKMRESVRTSKGWDSDLIMGILGSEFEVLATERREDKSN